MITNSEVQIIDYKKSDGAPANEGDLLTAHYKVALSIENLHQDLLIDSSWDKVPMRFTLGAGEILKGIDIGLVGMHNASTRILIIPPGLGFGERGVSGLVPPNSTLFFEVYLSSINKPNQ